MSSIINPNNLIYVVAIIVPVTLITTYTITDKLHPDEQIIPFISSSINNAPESCIGAYGLSIAAFLMVLIVLVRYLLLKNNIINNMGGNKARILNITSTWIGVISAFSMNGVAAFQYKNGMIPHLIFAALFFLCGFVYIVTQSILDGMVSTNNVSSKILIIRKILCGICSLFIVYVILQFFQNLVLKNISAIFEIISAGCIFVYLVTYYHEFSKIKLNIDFSLNNNYTSKQNDYYD